MNLTEFYKTTNGILYNNDCFDILDYLIKNNIKVNCVITDPPYCMNFVSNYRKIKYSQIVNDNNLNWLRDWVTKLNEIVEENSHLYIFCSWHNVDIFKQEIEKKIKIKNIIIWEKNNTGMGDLDGSYASKYEFIIYAQKGEKRKLKGYRDPDIIKSKRTNNVLHPTQKPLDLIKFLIEKSTEPGELVIDTFSGSGTTCYACEQLNRKWIAVEIDNVYCETIKKRLSNIQITLF